MITIKQKKDTWRLIVSNEEWEFKSRKELEKVLEELLDLKEGYGQLNDREGY